MDVLERLNRKFGTWYETLLGGESSDLRPRDILRRILAAMEDGRREGLDGRVYVPNVYTLRVSVASDEERQYLRTFLNAEELVAAVGRAIEQHGYQVRGPLQFTVEEASATIGDRVQIQCRFDASISAAPQGASAPPAPMPPAPMPPAAIGAAVDMEDYEPGTVPAVYGVGGASAAALASLTVRDGNGTLEDVYPIAALGARIGRGRQAGNDIVLVGDTQISKVHARIEYDRGRFLLRDENSTNGTFIGAERLASGKAVELHSGDTIRMGETTLLFRENVRESAPQSIFPPSAESVASQSEVRAGNQRAAYLVSSQGESYALAREMVLGRSLSNDIVAIGAQIAHRHALLTRRGDTIYVEDLQTMGGTFVNAERIPSNFPVALYDNDRIAFGGEDYRLRYADGNSNRAPETFADADRAR